ncbi:FAD-binding protein [uncultured Adlercreutzia sp.]|uniref:FAD-dependent oxidoreductase n=1 Tax=uncultured Adlercreutzia sp. TaxID=875803 RepID=UPI00266CB98E|nr:FAD-binding protein [uncultured Adlercreutzia sp.]
MMEKAKGLTSSRRDFLKASGLALLGSAAAAGAFGAVPTASAYAEGDAAAAAPAEAGIANFETDMYSDVFPTGVRYIPVIDAPTDMDRQGKVAFELREIGEDEITRTEETDVLVAGCGITGVCAALSASDDGTTQVLCLEKMSEGRGMFEGMGVTGDAAYYRVPIDPIKLWADRSPEAADWLQAKFDEGDGQITEGFKINNENAHHFDVPQTEVTFTSPQWSEQTIKNAGGAGIYIVKDLANTLSKRANAEVRYRSAVVKLEREEGGRVTGAICKDVDGYFRVNVKNGVVLATGGFDANPAMLKAWCRPEDIANAASWCPNYGTTGDGQLMGLAVGGQMDPLPAAVMNFDFGSPESFYSSNLGITGLVAGGLMINEEGRRFASESLPFQARSNAITAQRQYGENCWRVASSAQVPAPAVLEALEPFKEKGWAFEADSLEELAGMMEVAADTLVAEVARFNGFVDNKLDEDFNRPMEKAVKIEGEKYYAIKHQSSILATVSGLVVDYECRVLDYDNEVIPGLYAAGGASGGFFHTNYPRHIFGPSIGRCVTFGFVSGQSAAQGV